MLRAIIRWAIKRGHRVEDNLLTTLKCTLDTALGDEVELKAEAKEERKLEPALEAMNTEESGNGMLKEEDINMLATHIPLETLSVADLKEIVHLCCEARLGKLKARFMEQFLEDAPRFELTTPVPYAILIVHLRNSSVFTFQERFYDVSTEYYPRREKTEYFPDTLAAYHGKFG